MDYCITEINKPVSASSRTVAMTASTPTLIASADPNRIHISLESDSIIRFGGADVSAANGFSVPSTGYNPFTLTGQSARAAIYGFATGGADTVSVFEVIVDPS